MGKYLSPSLSQVQNAEIKCAVIWYPSDSGLFFLNAVRGALSDLRFPYNWEGDPALTEAIAGRFIETDLLTDATFFVKDCETLSEALDEDGTMAINVTVNQECGSGCGCGGGGNSQSGNYPTIPNPTDTPLPQLPPVLPVDDGSGVPDGFVDREDYERYKCAYATQLVRDFAETMGNFQVISGLTTLGSAYLVAQLSVAGTYSGIAVGLAAIGISGPVGLALAAAALAMLVGFGATAYDKFNEIHDYMTANEDAIICQVFNATSEAEVRAVFKSFAGDAVTNLGLGEGVGTALGNAVDMLVDSLVPSEIIIGLFQAYKDFGVSEFDCSSCGSGGGASVVWTFDTDNENWGFSFARAAWVNGTLEQHPKDGSSPDPTFVDVGLAEIQNKSGLTSPSIKMTAMSFDIVQNVSDAFANGRTVQVQLTFDDNTTWSSSIFFSYGNHVVAGWPDKNLHSGAGGVSAITIWGFSGGNAANGEFQIDNVAATFVEA